MRKAAVSLWVLAVQSRLIALVLGMIVVVPLVATPLDSRMRGLAALTVEAFAVILLFTLLWRSKWNVRREGILAFFRSGPNLPIVLFVGLVVVSCVMSPMKGYSEQEALRIGAGVLLYFVAAYQFRRSEHFAKLVDTLIVVAISASVIGFAEFSSSPDSFAVGPFGDHQLFGSFLMILLPIMAVIAITEKSMNRQLASQVAAVMLITSLLLAHSRSAWIGSGGGLLAAAFLVAWTITRPERKRSRRTSLAAKKHELILPVALIACAAGLFLLLTPQAGSIIGRAESLKTLKGLDAWEDRTHVWAGAFRMMEARPLTGFGVGLYPYYQLPYSDGCNMVRLTSRPFLSEQAHNFYLQTGAELGVPGLALFLAILAAFWITGIRRVTSLDSGLKRTLLIGCLASTVAFAIDAFASPSWQIGQVSIFFWLTMGIGAGCLQSSKSQEEVALPTVPILVTRPAAAMMSLGVIALLPTIAYAAGGDCYTQVQKATILTDPNQTSQPPQAHIKFTITIKNGPTYYVTLDSHTTYQVSGGGGTVTTGFNDPGNDANDYVVYNAVASDVGKTVKITGTYKCDTPNSASLNLKINGTGPSVAH